MRYVGFEERAWEGGHARISRSEVLGATRKQAYQQNLQIKLSTLAKHLDFPLTNPIQTLDAKPICTSMGIFLNVKHGILTILEKKTICLIISPWFKFRLSIMGLGLHELYHHQKDFRTPRNLDNHKQIFMSLH